MLEFKDNPKKLMRELDRFLSIYYGDLQLEYKPDLDELASWKIPQPLKDLYTFAGKYPGKYGIFDTQDSLKINSGEDTYGGKVLIVDENQGCWSCYTETEGNDPPVWTEHYGWKKDSPKWKLVNNSLSQFLVTFCLREALYASTYHFRFEEKIEDTVSKIRKQEYEVILLWQGIYYPVEDHVMSESNSFYLIEDSILVQDMWNSALCGTNYKNANKLLSLIKSELE